jgi:hypothetical protein
MLFYVLAANRMNSSCGHGGSGSGSFDSRPQDSQYHIHKKHKIPKRGKKNRVHPDEEESASAYEYNKVDFMLQLKVKFHMLKLWLCRSPTPPVSDTYECEKEELTSEGVEVVGY